MPSYCARNPYTGVYGLYFFAHRVPTPCELLSVDVDATIADVACSVKLVQEYHHSETQYGAVEARYTFPLPNRSAVSSFVLVKQDGSRVVGVVQQKGEARETYDNATQQGKLAGLVVQSTPDVFSVSVGNVQPNETVKVEICFTTELTEDEDNDQLRLSLPTYISARYGQAPAESALPGGHMLSTSAVTKGTQFRLKVRIEAPTPLAKIGSPSHTIETELGPDPSLPNAKDLPFSNFARVSLTSSAPLDKDFILTIKAAGLDAPRCFAEIHPSQESVALSLTLVPRFRLPDIPSSEFVFLIDRSGSMGGWGGAGRIATARMALVNMLHSLPHKDTMFNIVSFGSGHSFFWPSSLPYDQESLDEAKKHVDGMQADMGGTELASALCAVFDKRMKDRPTSLIVLTDGDTWDLNNTLASVKKAVDEAKPGAYLRIYALGIGDSASTAMVEGIARVGNGSSFFVSDNEAFAGKTARLLRAARVPLINNVRVAWGVDDTCGPGEKADTAPVPFDDDFELLSVSDTTTIDANAKKTISKTISLYDPESDEPLKSLPVPPPPPAPVKLPDPAPVQQSPYQIHGLAPSTRLYVYAILSPPAWRKGDALPGSVILSGSLENGDLVKLEVPVSQSHSAVSPFHLPIHTLAARKLIQDLEDGSHEFTDAHLSQDALARTVEASIVRLGKTYSLMSRHTSFVAVDESEAADARKRRAPQQIQQTLPAATQAPMAMSFGSAPLRALPPSTKGSRILNRSVFPPAPTSAPMATASGGAISDAGNPSRLSSKYDWSPPASDGHSTMNLKVTATRAGSNGLLGGFRKMSTAWGVSGSGVKPPPPGLMALPSRPIHPAPSTAIPNGRIRDDYGAESRSVGDVDLDASASATARVDAIVRQQTFNGSFKVTVLKTCRSAKTLETLVAALPPALRTSLGEQVGPIVATLVALRTLAKELRGEKDSWESVAEKGQDFVATTLTGAGVVETVDQVSAMIDAAL